MIINTSTTRGLASVEKIGATIVIGNESFVAYRTGLHKDRLSALKALRGADTLDYLIDDRALAYVRAKLPTTTLDAVLARFKNRSFLQESEFEKKMLFREFDKIFKPDTGYYALDRRIKKVLSRKTELLTVLEYPDTPLHNNPCELDTREKVVQRKIRNCHRSPAGAKASDIFLGLMGTCRKNKISFWDYMKDRIY